MVLSPALNDLCRNDLGIDPNNYRASELVPLICAGLYQKAESIKSFTATLSSFGSLIPNEGVIREETLSESRPKISDANSVLDSALFALME